MYNLSIKEMNINIIEINELLTEIEEIKKKYKMNRATIIGRIGKDAEVVNLDNGVLVKFSVATTEKWKDKQGQVKEQTEWHNVNYFPKSDKIAQYLLKGTLLMVEGRIQTKKYEEKYYTSIVCEKLELLSTKNEPAKESAASYRISDAIPEADNDLPF
jgi:single-strand DNA-binding protein